MKERKSQDNERKKAPRWISYIAWLGTSLLALGCGDSSPTRESQKKEEKPYARVLDEEGLEWMVNVKNNDVVYSVKYPQCAEIHVKDERGIRKLTEHEQWESITDVYPHISTETNEKGEKVEYVYFIRETSPDGTQIKHRGYRINIKRGKEEAVTPENEDWWYYFVTEKGTKVGIREGKVIINGQETGAKARTYLNISPDETKLLTHYVEGGNPSEVYLQEKGEHGWQAPIKIAEGYENPQFLKNGNKIFAKKGTSFYELDLKGNVLKEYNVGGDFILTPYVEDGKVYFTLNREGLAYGKLEEMLK